MQICFSRVMSVERSIYSALTVFRNGQVEVIPLDVDGSGNVSKILRSVLYFLICTNQIIL
jgi:hypothetical protein